MAICQVFLAKKWGILIKKESKPLINQGMKIPRDYSIDPEDRDKLMKDYSHGMKNKMQMLINIVARPNILLLDEPLTSLDVVVAEEMKQLLRSLKEGRVTIFSTHLMDLALDLCDVIVLLNHGELEIVDKENLDSQEFKEKILAALREENTVGGAS